VDALTKYTVTVEDKQYTIDLTKTENRESFLVKINDKPYNLELKDFFKYDTPVRVKLNEETFTIEIGKKEKPSSFEVKIKEIPVNAEVKTQQTNAYSQPVTTPIMSTPTVKAAKPRGSEISTEGTVTAPMAGKITAIKIGKGQPVKAGTVVCILEAMKMENEMVAPTNGVVKEIFVSVGKGVNKGDPMFQIEPSKD